MTYREEKLAVARNAVAEVLNDDELDAVYLAGSLTAGLGSPTSDVDVFAVTSGTGRTAIRQAKVGAERLDIETYTGEWFDGALRKLAAWEATRSDLRSKRLSETELDVLIRLRQSEVVKDSPRLAAYRRLLAENEHKLRQMALSGWGIDANAQLSDFRGSFQDGDLETAALLGQYLVVCGGKAVAAAAGDLYHGRKWVYCQLRRSAGESFPYERFSYLQSGAWARDEPAAGALELLSFTQTLMVAAQVLGWAEPQVTAWPFWSTGTDGYRRNPDFNVIRLSNGVLLNNELRSQFVVQPHVALVWGLCNGRTEKEVVEAALELGRYVGGDTQVALTAERVRQIIETLDARELVSQTRFR
ncbi:hypothetical protein [Nonomuraea sp. NPDC046570]|uniref:hypothetical protein n=1 Tax=Nonomuraea sp. NPDC046570 TaxID=3155255 RepID=UPI00340B483D